MSRVVRWYGVLVVRLRWMLIVGWLVLVAGAIHFLPALAGVQGTQGAFGGAIPPNASALRVQEQAIRELRPPLLSRTAVVQRRPGGLSLAEQERAVALAVQLTRHQLPGLERIAGALPVPNTLGLFPSASERGTTVITYLFFRGNVGLSERNRLAAEFARRYVDRPGAGFVGVTGAFAAEAAQGDAVTGSLQLVEFGAIAVVALVVGVTFRSVGAPVVALLAAGAAYFSAVHVLGYLGARFGIAVPGELEPLIVVLIVGVVTDYSVFFLSGYRRRLAEGLAPHEAAQTAARNVAPIVLTAGLAVAGGTATLLLAVLGLFARLGPGMAVSVVVAVIVAVTLVPALLAAGGRAVFWPGRVHRVDPDREIQEEYPRRYRLTRLLVRRPVAAGVLVVVIAALLAAASPLRHFDVGVNLVADLPAGAPPAAALRQAGLGFAPGIVAPAEVLVQGRGVATDRAGLARLQQLIDRQPGVAGVLGPAAQPLPKRFGVLLAKSGNAARFLVVLRDRPYGADAINDVQRLERRMPALLDRAGLAGATAGFAGDTALAAAVVSIAVRDFLVVGLATLGVLFVILVVFLRALVAPVLLLAASVLAVLAALGLTTWVFTDLLGFPGQTFYVPFAVAVLLVSFGSDYNIFLVGRVWRAAQQQPLGDAIVTGATGASSAITVAGVTLAFSFALLAIVALGSFREFAFAMVVGILIDTFLVRSLLAPALLTLLGRWASWPSRRLGGRTASRTDLDSRAAASASSAPDAGRP